MKRFNQLFSIVTCLFILTSLLLLTGGVTPLQAQNVVVSQAVPDNAPQGTVNLNVTIKGKGFKKGAVAKWFVTGTTNPGGVTVNSTAFVNASELLANITIGADAQTELKFDIVVMLAGGRTGKGIELFSVTEKSHPSTCEVLPLPDAFTLVAVLDSATPSPSGEFGRGIAVSRVALQSTEHPEVLVAAVASRTTGKVEVFLLDPASGQLLSTLEPLVIPNAFADQGFMWITQGDTNGGSVPDIVVASRDVQAAYAFLGQVVGGVLGYSSGIPILPPAGESAGYFGEALAVGDIDGTGDNEVIVGAPGADAGHAKRAGAVFVFKFDANSSSFVFDRTITAPSPRGGDDFGRSVAVGEVTGDGYPDLVVGAMGRDQSKTRDVGAVLVFPGPVVGNPRGVIELTTGVQGQNLGYRTVVNNVRGGTVADIVAGSYLKSPVVVFTGPVSSGDEPSYTLPQNSGGTEGYGTNISSDDINEDGHADVLVAAPNYCTGIAYVCLSGLSGPLSNRYVLYPPDDSEDLMYGWAVTAAPGSPVFLVGEPRRDVDGITNAGRVYVYRVE
jgi:hypothetical protein